MRQRTSWDPETTEGKKNREALRELVSKLKYREDLSGARRPKRLKDMRYESIATQLLREERNQTDIGKIWAKVPKEPNILFKCFPDSAVHPALAEALKTKTLEEVYVDFPAYNGLTARQRGNICELLAVTRPFSGTSALRRTSKKDTPKRAMVVTSKNWWEHLSPELKTEFNTTFLEDYKNPEATNHDLLQRWPEAINADGLRRAALNFGEKRNRIEIRADHQAKTRAEILRQKIVGFEETVRSIDEVAKKHKGIPRTDATAPFIVRAKTGQESVHVIGSTFIGMVMPASTYEWPLSNTLRQAEERRTRDGKPDIVLMTGDIVYLDTIRYSNLTAKRSVLESIPLVPDVIGDQWVREQIAKGELVFLTFKEKFEMLLEVVRKMFVHDGKPIYGGKILICLGRREEEIANYIVNERGNAEVALVRGKFLLELSDLRLARKEAQREHDDEKVRGLEAKIKAIELRMRERLKATSIWRQQLKELFEIALRYVAVRLEEIIPNSEVISAGVASIEVGEELVEVHQKGSESPSDTLENRLIKQFSIRATAGERVPDLTIGGGLNPVMTRGEIDQARGEFTSPNMTAPFIITASTCTPSEYLRDIAKEIHGATTAGGQAKLIAARDFTGGTFDMDWVDRFPRVRFWTDNCLTNRDLWSSDRAIREMFDGENMIYELVSGCEHRGQNWAAYFNIPGADMFTETVWRFVLEHNIPIHMVHFLGDKFTGHNFPGKSYQKPEKWLSPDQVRNLTRALDLWPEHKKQALEILRSNGSALKFVLGDLESGGVNPTTWKQKYEYMRFKMRENSVLTGIDALDLQRESWQREVLPLEAEMVARALERAHKAGVCTLGHSIGLCICETGNHVPNTEHKTMGNQWKEGPLVANDLQNTVRMTHPELWQAGRLTEDIISPVSGILTKTEGLFGRVPPKLLAKLSPEERERLLAYRLAAKHKGAQGGSKYTDLMRVIRDEDAKRGRRRAHGTKFSVSHFGHSHYCFSTFGRNRCLTAGGCHTFDDPYGEAGNYRLTSVCVTVYGFPARGPAWGPITEVHLRFAELKDYMQKPWPVDVNRLFPNALK